MIECVAYTPEGTITDQALVAQYLKDYFKIGVASTTFTGNEVVLNGLVVYPGTITYGDTKNRTGAREYKGGTP